MKSENKDLKMICVRLPRELHLSAKKRALEEGRSLQDLSEEVLQDYMIFCEEQES